MLKGAFIPQLQQIVAMMERGPSFSNMTTPEKPEMNILCEIS